MARAWADLKAVTNHWWRFRIPAAVLTAGFAVWGALVPSKAGAGERVALAAGGSVGGALIVGTVALLVLLVSAPLRQRNELRKALALLNASSDDEVDDPVSKINREIAAGERLLTKADDPNWPDFQRDHALNEWEPRAQGVIRDLAPRYYYWYSDIAPKYRLGSFPGQSQSPLERFRLHMRGRLERLRDIRDRLLARTPEGHPEGPRRTALLLLADVLMDARQSLSRLMQEGDLDALREWDRDYRQLCEEAFDDKQVAYLFENGFRAERWGAQGNVDEDSMKRYMERSLRLGEFMYEVQGQSLRPGFDVRRWLTVF